MIAHKNNKGKDGNPAMKKNGIFSAKSVVTLFSVLSVVLMFSLVCTGVLFLLNQMDIVHFPQAENSTCVLASPLPTKAVRLCGAPLSALAMTRVSIQSAGK